jgi:flagellar motor switch protein FliG
MPVHAEQSLRKVAIIVRNLDKDLRDGVLQAIQQKDKETGDKVANLMIVWEDLPLIDDRSLQEVFRCIDQKQLALALHGAPGEIEARIKSNISERAAAMVSEEVSLMSSIKKEDVHQAREKIVAILRERFKMDKTSLVEE